MRVEKGFEDLLRSLNANKVKYCIVGAYALALHARPRYTKDIDIFVKGCPDNARNLVKALEEFGFKGMGLKDEDFVGEGRSLQLGYEPVRVDVITSIDGCTFEEVWKRKKVSRYGRVKACFIGKKELIKNKRASNRPQDRADLDILLRQ